MVGPRILRIAIGLSLAAAVSLQAEKRLTPAELTNLALSPDLAPWLVGPVARIASKSEIKQYLALVDDEAASAFIDSFWSRRASQGGRWPDEQPRAIFDRRAEEADRLFTEGVTLGRRTNRGEIHVVYGEPEAIRFESNPDAAFGPLEIWEYSKDTLVGLDRKKPKATYRFVKQGELTIFISLAKTRLGSSR